MSRVKIILMLGILFGLIGCDSGIVEPDANKELTSAGANENGYSKSEQETGDKRKVVDLFDLSVDVNFDQKASELTIQSSFQANLPVQNGRFEVFAPELSQLHGKGVAQI